MGKNKKLTAFEKNITQNISQLSVNPVVNTEKVVYKHADIRNKVALAAMIKNEEKRIEVTFESMRPIADTFVIFDTGSTDRTIEVCRTYCQKWGIRLLLKEGPFVNFCVSRNVMLDFADEVLVDKKGKPEKRFLVLMDCNDELQSQDELANFVRTHNGPQTGFHLRQKWWTGLSLDTYFNIRMVISHNGWRYEGVVHEYIVKNGVNDGKDIIKCDNIVLYQDRTVDDDKSQKRFKRDKDLLYAEHIRDQHEPRTIFYLAQTCGCLTLINEAYQYYLLRIKEEGFIEEQYHAYYRLGEINKVLNHPWEETILWYMRAFGHSQRVEPLVRIAEHYTEHNHLGENKPNWMLAYLFISMACNMIWPHNQILFVDRKVYVYTRWHLLGRIGYYVGRYREGKAACIRALQYEDNQIDRDNLVLYLKKDKEIYDMGKTGSYKLVSLLPIGFDQGESPITQNIDDFDCINSEPEYEDNYDKYKSLVQSTEKTYHTFYDLGRLSSKLNHSWGESFNWYLKAFGQSQRVEPLLRIAEHYMTNNYKSSGSSEMLTAYMFSDMACNLILPDPALNIQGTDSTKINKEDYLHKRWQLISVSGFNTGRYRQGKSGLQKALMFNPTSEENKRTLNLYLKQEEEIKSMTSTQRYVFKSLIILSHDEGDILPYNEEGSGIISNRTKQDVLKVGYTELLKAR